MSNGYDWIPLESLIPNPHNPRTTSLTVERFKKVLTDLYAHNYLLDCTQPVDEDAYLKLIRRLTTVHKFDRTQLAEFKRYMTLAIDMKGDPERLINPIRYIVRDDGVKEISMGSSRWFAHYLMNADRIKAEVISYSDNAERIDRELSENIQRTEMSDADIILALRYAQSVRGTTYTVSELMQKTAKSRGTANMIQKILNVGDDAFFDTLHEYKSVNAMLKALTDDQPKDRTLYDCEDPVVVHEIAHAQSLRLLTVNGHGSQMGSIMFFLNDFLGYQIEYYERIYDRDNPGIPEHVLDYMEAQKETLAFAHDLLIKEMITYNKGRKGTPRRYTYNRDNIQLVMDIVSNASFQRHDQMLSVGDFEENRRMTGLTEMNIKAQTAVAG